MDYNTKRKQLNLPEYGRNIQRMIDYACTIEDRNKRNDAAKSIIAVMGNMNPHLRDTADYVHKLWDHLAIISDFKLDIDSPYPLPDLQKLNEKPNKVPYNSNKIHYKHYGRTVELLLDKAIEMEEGPEKQKFLEIIANHMKKAFLTWNKDAVNDQTILDAMRLIAKDENIVSDDMQLIETKELLNRQKRKKASHQNNRKKR